MQQSTFLHCKYNDYFLNSKVNPFCSMMSLSFSFSMLLIASIPTNCLILPSTDSTSAFRVLFIHKAMYTSVHSSRVLREKFLLINSCSFCLLSMFIVLSSGNDSEVSIIFPILYIPLPVNLKN